MTAIHETPPATDEPGPCPDPDKKAFGSRLEAMAFTAEDDQRHGTDNTPYKCTGCGSWHNTTTERSRKRPCSSSPRINAEAANWPAAPLRPGTDLNVGFYVLHPKTAAYWLANLNIHNRNLRKTSVSGYAIDIHTGGWDFNGDTIRFDTDGAMFDGQHRCSAIVAEGIPVPVILVTGLDPVAQDTTDTGMRRTFADALKLAGETDVNNLASITMAALLWKSGQIRSLRTGTSVRMLQKVLRDHPELREAVLVARRVRKHTGVQNSVLGLASWLFSRIDTNDHDDFFNKLVSGADLGENSPIRRLRERLLTDMNAKRRMSKAEVLALLIKAWNHYRDGNEVRQLRWIVGGAKPEAMPTPH
jgi:hypothetical protein